MKKLFMILMIVLLLAIVVHAKKETNTFSVGESYIFDDKNITVIQIDDDKDKVVVCVNNAKGIVDESKQINDVYFTIKSASGNSAKIDMTYTCNDDDNDCVCRGIECSNDRCVPKINEVTSTDDTDNSPTIVKPKPTKPSIPTGNSVQEVRVVRSAEKSSGSGAGIVFVVLLLIVIILAILSLTIKKKEKN